MRAVHDHWLGLEAESVASGNTHRGHSALSEAGDKILTYFSGQHHLGDVTRLDIGNAQTLIEARLNPESIEQLGDLLPTPVDNDQLVTGPL